jgi:hypothetical protein
MMDFLNKVTELLGWPGLTAFVTGLLEILMRVLPTENPMSIFLGISKVIHVIANFFDALSKFLDGLGLQNLKK